jgi:hypothetical protein
MRSFIIYTLLQMLLGSPGEEEGKIMRLMEDDTGIQDSCRKAEESSKRKREKSRVICSELNCSGSCRDQHGNET